MTVALITIGYIILLYLYVSFVKGASQTREG